MTMPHPDVRHVALNRLSNLQLIQRMLREFWDGWSHEYLARLQQRPKWNKPQKNMAVGQLVLIKEDNLPPSRWSLERITRTFPGKDGLVRAVEVKNAESTVSRPIHKLCLSPVDTDMDQQEQSISDQASKRPKSGTVIQA